MLQIKIDKLLLPDFIKSLIHLIESIYLLDINNKMFSIRMY
jgi:hypothetical protein